MERGDKGMKRRQGKEKKMKEKEGMKDKARG